MVFVQANNRFCPGFGSGRTSLLRFLSQRHQSRQLRCARIIPEKFVAGAGMFPGEHTRAPSLAGAALIRATDSGECVFLFKSEKTACGVCSGTTDCTDAFSGAGQTPALQFFTESAIVEKTPLTIRSAT